MRRQIQYLDAEQKRLTNLMPLSNYGPIRVPRHINAKIVIGKANLHTDTINKNRNAEDQRQHQLLKQFNCRGLPKNRWFDIDASLPLTEKSVDIGALLEKDPDESSLGQFLGFESDDEDQLRGPVIDLAEVNDIYEEEKT